MTAYNSHIVLLLSLIWMRASLICCSFLQGSSHMTQMGLLIFLYNYNLLHFSETPIIHGFSIIGPSREPPISCSWDNNYFLMHWEEQITTGRRERNIWVFGVYLGCRQENVWAVFEVFRPFSSLSVPPCLRLVFRKWLVPWESVFVREGFCWHCCCRSVWASHFCFPHSLPASRATSCTPWSTSCPEFPQQFHVNMKGENALYHMWMCLGSTGDLESENKLKIKSQISYLCYLSSIIFAFIICLYTFIVFIIILN